jgi:hypothetical protein
MLSASCPAEARGQVSACVSRVFRLAVVETERRKERELETALVEPGPAYASLPLSSRYTLARLIFSSLAMAVPPMPFAASRRT